MMKAAETLIVEQLKAGNPNAYQYLYDCHYVILCHIAYNYVKDHFLAETIVGDTIFHVWEIRESLDIKVSIRSYLSQAVRNRCLNYLNNEKKQKEITFSNLSDNDFLSASFSSADSHPLGYLLELELEQNIRMAIQMLPKECRVVFIKSRFEGKSYKEISDELGITTNTVKYHINNALRILNDTLKKYF